MPARKCGVKNILTVTMRFDSSDSLSQIEIVLSSSCFCYRIRY